jgi:hypothetical protein
MKLQTTLEDANETIQILGLKLSHAEEEIVVKDAALVLAKNALVRRVEEIKVLQAEIGRIQSLHTEIMRNDDALKDELIEDNVRLKEEIAALKRGHAVVSLYAHEGWGNYWFLRYIVKEKYGDNLSEEIAFALEKARAETAEAQACLEDGGNREEQTP